MKNWKNELFPALFAFAGLACLVPAILKQVIKGEPVNSTSLAIAIMFFIVAVVFLAITPRSVGGFDRPSASPPRPKLAPWTNDPLFRESGALPWR